MAETEDSEPLDTLLTYTHFPGVRFRPLSHVSNRVKRQNIANRKRTLILPKIMPNVMYN